jgi:hypothetical protein
MFQVHPLIEVRDLWVGVYWRRYPNALEVYLCLVPIVPIRFYWQWGM